MKNIKKILVLGNIGVFILIYITMNKSDQSNSNDQILLDNIYNIQEFSINKNDQNISFKKSNNEWDIELPFYWKANELAISKFIAIFSHLKLEKLLSIEEIQQRGELLKDYGIDINSTNFSIKNTKFTTKLLIGKKTRDKKFYFATFENNGIQSENLWRISTEIEEISNMTINDWIQEELINQNIYSIEELTVIFKLAKNKFSETTLKKLDGEWEFIKPFKSSANDEKVRLLLNKLLTEKISNININEHKNDLNGKIREDWKIKLQITANNDTSAFKFGENILEGNINYRHCLTDESNHLIQINDSFIELLSDWSSKLRERKIFEHTEKEINTIEFILPDTNFTISNLNNNNWSIINKNQPNEIITGDSESIKDLISMLNGLEVKEFLSINSLDTDNKTTENINSKFKLIISMYDTTRRTFIISKSDKDASLWKTFIKEESLLCLVEKNWEEIFRRKIYDYKNRKLFSENEKINLVQFSSLDQNKTSIKFTDEKLKIMNEIINELKVKDYINNKSKKEGTWNGGDWVPWVYELTLSTNSNSPTKLLRFSNSINEDNFLGNMSDNNLTFELPISNIQTIINTLPK